jgi:hypothetical protein
MSNELHRVANNLGDIQDKLEVTASSLRSFADDYAAMLNTLRAAQLAADPNKVLELEQKLALSERRVQTLELLLSTYEVAK